MLQVAVAPKNTATSSAAAATEQWGSYQRASAMAAVGVPSAPTAVTMTSPARRQLTVT